MQFNQGWLAKEGGPFQITAAVPVRTVAKGQLGTPVLRALVPSFTVNSPEVFLVET